MSARAMRIEKLRYFHMRGGRTASSAGIRDSQYRNPANRKMEMMRGARTYAVAQPSVEPDVTAKMNKMTATVSMLTPGISNATCLERSRLALGIKKKHTSATLIPTIATNQKIQLHPAYWTSTAPMRMPRMFPMAPALPKREMARAWWDGLGKSWTMRDNAEGMVSAPPIPPSARSTRMAIF
jgi:hypothetical protein